MLLLSHFIQEGAMRVAEALSLRSELRQRIARHGQLLVDEAVVEADAEVPSYAQRLSQFDALRDSLLDLERRLHATNEQHGLTQLRLERDALIKASEVLFSAARQSTSEWCPVRNADQGQLRAMANDYARRARELDNQLQEANWTTDLIE
jgi:hypothetical protein